MDHIPFFLVINASEIATRSRQLCLWYQEADQNIGRPIRIQRCGLVVNEVGENLGNQRSNSSIGKKY